MARPRPLTEGEAARSAACSGPQRRVRQRTQRDAGVPHRAEDISPGPSDLEASDPVESDLGMQNDPIGVHLMRMFFGAKRRCGGRRCWKSVRV